MILEGWTFLLTGVVVGLAGGFAPGPITTLVIVQSLRYGLREGLKVAIAPALTDAPIAVAALLAVGQLRDAAPRLGAIALAGAAFLSYLAYESLTAPPPEAVSTGEPPGSLRKGILTNLANPNPYLFWFTIGAPTVLEASRLNGLYVVGFLVGLYTCLIGAKVAFAALAARGRSFLAGAAYRRTLRVLGIALLVFALKFAFDGLGYLGLR